MRINVLGIFLFGVAFRNIILIFQKIISVIILAFQIGVVPAVVYVL